MATVLVKLWDQVVGVIADGENGRAPRFQYTTEFAKSGLEIAPLRMPLRVNQIFQFPELTQSSGYQDTFHQLPGLLADALPEKFGNQILSAMLARKGLSIDDLTPVQRLSYLGKRGMGALEFEPDEAGRALDDDRLIDVAELVEVAREVLQEYEGKSTTLSEDKLQSLIAVGTSAGGAKAKAVIAWNRETNEVRSGQIDAPPGFEHWLIKFDDFENEEHAISKEVGKVEYAYYLMAQEAGIDMMESRIFEAAGLSHFMTKRFDRCSETGEKMHVQSFCALSHADRNPPGRYGYEALFAAAKQIKCKQVELDELFRRMVFNVVTRNQDDHTKNHAFQMDRDGNWKPTPAYDLCFSYKPGNKFIANHQMSVNGKRDGFEMADLLAAGKAADVKKPKAIIEEVMNAAKRWPEFASKAKLSSERTDAIHKTFRSFEGKPDNTATAKPPKPTPYD